MPMNTDNRRNKIIWTNKDHAKKVLTFAHQIKQTKNLKDNLKKLMNIARNCNAQIYMSYDDQRSFYFIVKRGPNGPTLMNGGLIYHGPHDGFGSGSAPTFSACLTPTTGWSIHT